MPGTGRPRLGKLEELPGRVASLGVGHDRNCSMKVSGSMTGSWACV